MDDEKTLSEHLNELKDFQYESYGYPAFILFCTDNKWHACFRNPRIVMQSGIGSTPEEACKKLIEYLKKEDKWNSKK